MTPLSLACCSLDSGLFLYGFQSLEVLRDAIFPSRVYHRELHSLKQQFCVLKSDLCKLQETLKVGVAKQTNPKSLSEKTITIGKVSGSKFGYFLKCQAERLPSVKEEGKGGTGEMAPQVREGTAHARNPVWVLAPTLGVLHLQPLWPS